MASRMDNLPKAFRIVPCARCEQNFQSSGPNHKRCDTCKAEHKREYEARNKLAKARRRTACSRCGVAFVEEVHGHQKYCEPCAKASHTETAIRCHSNRYHRVYKTDPGHRLHNSISTLVRRDLTGSKAGRKWESLVGYTLSDLRRHLERQFTKGMTWENIGKWHVDHILPRASFTFSSADDPEFKACWALTNLRPLWGVENQKKSNRRTHLV